MAQSPAIKRVVVALSETLRITRKAAKAMIERPDNADRMFFSRSRFDDPVVVPKPDGMIVLFDRLDTRTVMAGTLSTQPGDLDRWLALPESERAEPSDLPVH